MRSAPFEAAGVREFLDEMTHADGHPPLSEHKMATLGGAGSLAGVWSDHAGLCLVAVAAWHPGGHWAIEAAVAPRRRTAPEEVAAIERATGIIPIGESHSFWAFRPGQVEAALRMGYEQIRAVLRMSGPMPTAGARSVPGISIEPMAEIDIEAIVGVNNRAFADHREQGSMTVDGFRLLMGLGWFDPRGVHVARSSDRIVGFCVAKHEERAVGEVFVLAVDPDLAGSGIGRALVDRAFAGLADQGAVRAQAWVDAGNRPAVGLYRALGLAEDFRTSELVPAARGEGPAG
jgi:mycothiol synthase